jgi:VEFS-Box of polycomb protein
MSTQPHEKAFMKLWNLHSRAFHCPADDNIPLANEVFARRFGPQLLELGLSGNLLLHLMNCWDLSVIDPQHILICMAILEDTRERLAGDDSSATADSSNAGGRSSSDVPAAAAAAAAAGAAAAAAVDDDSTMEG